MVQETIPNTFIERWEAFYGVKRCEKIISALQHTDPRIILPNFIKIQKKPLKEVLEKKRFKLKEIEHFNAFIVLFEPFNIVSTPEYLSGLFSIQSITSLIPSKSLSPSSDSMVVDLAAAPGIKTCLLAQEMENQGTILALEKSKHRIASLKANIARMGVWNTVILNMDALRFPQLNISADHILLDAPCSGTGLKLSKNKRIAPRRLNDIFRHAELQQQLLENAWKQLKLNGTLIYSTCSLEPEEGEIQIDRFIKNHSGEIELQPIPFKIGISGDKTNWKFNLHPQLIYTRRIFPESGKDGFFVAHMKKVSN